MVGKLSVRKRMKNSMFLSILILTALLVRIGYIQFIDGPELKEKAYAQQTSDRLVSAKRGTIYEKVTPLKGRQGGTGWGLLF